MLKSKPLVWIGQVLLYALFALIIGTFSSAPKYQHLAPEQALIKLSFSHLGKLIATCHQRTPEELAKLPRNMRAPMQCQRERSPVSVEVDLDGVPAYRHVAQPSGLSRDGASSVYQRIEATAGEHRLAVRMKDSVGGGDFDYKRDEVIHLKPGQVLVIDFSQEKGSITLQ